VLILPAIDIRGGKCVRLRQGDYAQETIFDDDPVAVARRWANLGARWLHLVDLDGAKAGQPVNGDCIRRIVEASQVLCQLGGGIRTDYDIETALGWGINRVVIGTRAVKSPEWFEQVCRRWPGKVVLGIDARNGNVATEGWLDVSEIAALDLAKRFAALPLGAVVYTDISRDGMMSGANLEAMSSMASAVSVPVIASGGVTTLDDVHQLAEHGLAGCIIGRALYEGRLDLKQSLRIADRELPIAD
jgi:phosphoribosylformimino-5-aminoimidazole carboxamide ribotide isomerase